MNIFNVGTIIEKFHGALKDDCKPLAYYFHLLAPLFPAIGITWIYGISFTPYTGILTSFSIFVGFTLNLVFFLADSTISFDKTFKQKAFGKLQIYSIFQILNGIAVVLFTLFFASINSNSVLIQILHVGYFYLIGFFILNLLHITRDTSILLSEELMPEP
jgi:hypothetical protein